MKEKARLTFCPYRLPMNDWEQPLESRQLASETSLHNEGIRRAAAAVQSLARFVVIVVILYLYLSKSSNLPNENSKSEL